WIRELLTGDSESLPYRITGTLLLLYAQPITRLVTLRTDDLSITPDGPSLTFGTDLNRPRFSAALILAAALG
ncbi:MAG TPA: hypothetical protein VK053_10320, partial [Jiangellaceae bacterium]|nr:hypothetical protein [Jiangellaceae bacterium]